VKAVLGPILLDIGLAPDSGIYEHTAYGGEPGRLVLEAGAWDYAAWTSPVREVPLREVTEACATWEERVPYMRVTVSLRSGLTAAAVAQAPWQPLRPGEVVPLAPFFQMRVAFTDCTWAGEEPGSVAGLSLEGRVVIPETEIVNPGTLQVELARDFSQVRPGSHRLELDNRRGQWLPHTARMAALGLLTAERYVELYHGWERPDGEVEWLRLYRGSLQELADLGHAWRGRHLANLLTQDWVAARLQLPLGAPGSDGERRPFLRGAYLARAELVASVPAEVGEPRKQGSGSATLQVLGTFQGLRDKNFLLEAETSGEVGGATCRWSVNHGQSWRERQVPASGAEDPVELEDGLAVYWESGNGPDFQAGDRFTFTATAPRHHYRVWGGPFAGITAVFVNGEETTDGLGVDPATGEIVLVGRTGVVEARVVKDTTTHPVDIITDILTEVGLGDCLNRDSFELAKSMTPEYVIGVYFENVSAAQALREILKRTLYDLWVDFGEIKIRGYLGDDI
jgi:hypothetical protein